MKKLLLCVLLAACAADPEQQRVQLAILRESAISAANLLLLAKKIDEAKHLEITLWVQGISDLATMLTALKQVNSITAPPAPGK